MTSSVVRRMISKFEAAGFLGDRPLSGRLSTYANAAWAVQKEMDVCSGFVYNGKSALVKMHVALAFHALVFG